MKIIFFPLIIYLIINKSYEQNYCDIDQYCNSCTFCGETSNNYCYCKFNNGFCIREDSTLYFYRNFFIQYDKCESKNDIFQNICGESDVKLDSGKDKTISYTTSETKNLICYYNFRKSENNDNKMGIKIIIQQSKSPSFDFYYTKYNNDIVTKNGTISSKSITNNFFEIRESNCQRIAIYIVFKDSQNLEYLTLILSNIGKSNENDNPSSENPGSRVVSSSGGNNVGIIVGCLVGGVALITGIVIIYICITKNKKKPISIINSTSNMSITNINKSDYSEYINIANMNKEKMNNLFQTELIPQKYNKSASINDCYNCTICMEDFVDNSSNVIITKCGHTFHDKCFKNWTFKNILCPKCPNCNYLILGPESQINIPDPVPSILNDLSYHPGGNTTTIGITQ